MKLKTTARVAGLMYLLVIVFGVFSEMFVRGTLIETGNAAATVNNIVNGTMLFRLGFVSDLIMMVCYLMLAYTFYVLLKPVNNNTALLFLLTTIVSVAILCLNMLNHYAPLIILTGNDWHTILGSEHLQAQVMFYLELHKTGYNIAQIFFGLWLVPLGILVYRSGYFPKFMGVLLIIACVAMLVDFFTFFLFPDYLKIVNAITAAPAVVPEILFCLWLLIMGAKNGGAQRE